ncbi:MAG: hypothetical protein QGF12_05295 [SAR202 cluster bacterium]|jgi:DNA polymerase-4/protein ImuB|nr:hypothetical protein [SAR202 cluster bacterium]
MKIACVLVTHLPVKAEIQRTAILRDKPILIITQSSDGPRVLDISSEVKGVFSGMPLQEALSRSKDAVLVESDEAYYDQVFDQMMEGLFNRSPLVEKSKLGCAFVDISGVEKLYGGEDGIVSTLLGAVEPHLGPRIGLANSKFPAYVAALNSNPGQSSKVPKRVPYFLRNLPVDLLPFSWDDRLRLHNFGLQTMGQIAALSIGSMQAQFGIRGRVAWELANGIDKSPFIPSKYKEMMTDHLDFPVPATSLSMILPAMEVLLGRIFSHPLLRRRCIRSILIQANVRNRPPWVKRVAFKSPVGRKDTAFSILRNALKTTDIPGPLEDISMKISDIAGEFGMQTSLLVDIRKRRCLQEAMQQLETRLRVKPPIYKVMDMEPCSRIPERRRALVEFRP